MRLITFGGLRIESAGDAAAPRLRRPWLAMLAVIAAAGDHGISRDRLIALFWSESDEEHARQSARQALYGLRQELGPDVIRSSSSMVSLAATTIGSDVADFRAALAAGDRARAVELARAPFLDAFYLPGAAAFERWVEEERTRIATARTSALLTLAADAARAGQQDDAVAWWRELVAADPLSGRFAVGFLKSLAARGDRAEALAFARQHEAVIRRELETDPDPHVRQLEVELRAMPSSGAPRSNPTSAVPEPELRDAAPGAPLPAGPRGLAPGAAARTSRRLLVLAPVVLLAVAVLALRNGWPREAEVPPTIAVGFIRETGVPDSLRLGRVLTDMLATNLARVEGLRVLANFRVLELMRAGADSAAGYADASRRAGASELLEGEVRMQPTGLAMEMRSVDLRTGVVRSAFRVSAADRHQLVDSLTLAVARAHRLRPPAGPLADVTTTSATAYRFYEEGVRAYLRLDWRAARQLMRAALEEDSSFAMAAYYEAQLAARTGGVTPDGRHAGLARRTALQLARGAPQRERLVITANMLVDDLSPSARAVAESLATMYPDDPSSLVTLGLVKAGEGDWAGSVAEIERAIAIDSAAEPSGSAACRVCPHYEQLGQVYLWWDSLAAAERTADRYLRRYPTSPSPLYLKVVTAARRGDSATTYARFRHMLAEGLVDRSWRLRLDLQLEDYDAFDRGVPQLLASSDPDDWRDGAWLHLISLRNQGRLREAVQFHRAGRLPGLPAPALDRGPDVRNEAILALERGDPRVAARSFRAETHVDTSLWSAGHVARLMTWQGTLTGMALAAAGDTLALLAMADSVEDWGRGSHYGRDRRAHHYLRGMVHTLARRDEHAVREFRAAVHSSSLGFTRVNAEMAKSLLRLERPREAIDILQPALRGEVEASNLYVTRTELHELLALAFDGAGMRDSAAVHYRAVAKAWVRADPEFHARQAKATSWLASHAGSRLN